MSAINVSAWRGDDAETVMSTCFVLGCPACETVARWNVVPKYEYFFTLCNR